MQKTFELLATDRHSKARRGCLTTAHGAIDTPAFMPVGTQGSVKGVSPRELRGLNAQIVLGNTYHLFVRPGLDVIKHFGGLHNFMNWDGPILTDSGGYQIFSLAKLRKITERAWNLKITSTAGEHSSHQRSPRKSRWCLAAISLWRSMNVFRIHANMNMQLKARR
jgi:queuine tRNA-ribosyltransferase